MSVDDDRPDIDDRNPNPLTAARSALVADALGQIRFRP
jgi:hypothetical protein